MILEFSGTNVTISTESNSIGPFKTPNGPCGDLSSLTEVYTFMEQNGAPFNLLDLAYRVATTSPIYRNYLKRYVWNKTHSIMRIGTSPRGTLVYTEVDLNHTVAYQWSTYGPSPAFGEIGKLISTVGNTYTEDCLNTKRLMEIQSHLSLVDFDALT